MTKYLYQKLRNCALMIDHLFSLKIPLGVFKCHIKSNESYHTHHHQSTC